MLVVLSPAKSLNFETPFHVKQPTQPLFVKQASVLMKLLRQYDVPALSQLMHISDKLAHLNVARNLEWQPVFDEATAKPAILAFDGDVYLGFDAKTLSARELERAQKMVRTLSGLYGILRPLDLMRAYRLEMGTALANPQGKDLYAFWGDSLANHLNHELDEHKVPALVNLASDEYFKAVPVKSLRHPVIQPVFHEGKNGSYKVVSFFAKRARGVMARFIVQHKIEKPELLKGFTENGYRFLTEKNGKNGIKQWIFVRESV